MLVAGLIAIGLLVLFGVVALGLRRFTLDEGRTEKKMREPGAHTLMYTVPNGQDPAILISALHQQGFTARSDLRGGLEHLLVDCPDPQQRSVVRSIIEHVETTGIVGSPMHVDHVSFEDEH